MTLLRPETRGRARALQLLYAWESDGRTSAEAILLRLDRMLGTEPIARRMAGELFRGVASEKEQLDGEIAPAARHWRLDRLALIDRNILRIGAFELVHQRVPPRVAIDEALWLSHRFGGPESPAFVNGVLDHVARAMGRL